MWKLMRLMLFVWTATCLGAGCAAVRKGKLKKGATKAEDGPVLIGMIEMINPEQNYVLIKCERAHALPAGTELIAIDPSGAQSRLVLTPERKGLHLTADIKQGNPKALNLVIQPKAGSALPPVPDSTPTSAGAATTVPAMVPAPTGVGSATALPEPIAIDAIPLEPIAPSKATPALKPIPPAP